MRGRIIIAIVLAVVALVGSWVLSLLSRTGTSLDLAMVTPRGARVYDRDPVAMPAAAP